MADIVGSIVIVKLAPLAYTVVLAAYAEGAGAAPPVNRQGVDQLKRFLAEIGIDSTVIDGMATQLEIQSPVQIPNEALTRERLTSLGLMNRRGTSACSECREKNGGLRAVGLHRSLRLD